jgi:hypothetical protein
MRKKEYRGFSYNYDLGPVKVEKPIPKAVGKIAKKWLAYFALSDVELMLIAGQDYDPLSSGSGFTLFKGEIMLSPSNLDKIKERDFDLICILMENDEAGKLFKRRDEMEMILLRELVHIVHPDTIGDRDRCNKMVETILAERR